MKFDRFLLFLLVSLFFSCNKENKYTTITLNFHTSFNGSAFNPGNTFPDGQGRDIRLELIKFYVGNITFTANDGTKELVSEIELLDLSSGTASVEVKVPPGKYTSISFGIGVPQTLNEADPTNYTEEGHPLSTTQNTYWGMNGMYRFIMIDGRYDLEPDQIFDGTFSYHTGFNSSYRNKTFTRNFEFEKKGTASLLFDLDVAKILEGSAGNLDIINESNYHGEQNFQYLADILSDNFAAALQLE